MEISALLDGQLHIMSKVVFYMHLADTQKDNFASLNNVKKKTQKQSDDNV